MQSMVESLERRTLLALPCMSAALLDGVEFAADSPQATAIVAIAPPTPRFARGVRASTKASVPRIVGKYTGTCRDEVDRKFRFTLWIVGQRGAKVWGMAEPGNLRGMRIINMNGAIKSGKTLSIVGITGNLGAGGVF